MPIPSNHKHVLPFMFPNAEADAWLVYEQGGTLAFRYWNVAKAGGAEPTDQEMADAAASPEFDVYMNVPDEVTNYQLKRALNTVPADRAAVDALVAASNDQDTIDGWNNALTFKSTNPLFQAAIVNLGWTQQKVNDYLILAKSYD